MRHWISATIACALLCTSVLAADPAKPNILFILVDDMGWRDLACYGNEVFETPNIDKLAAGGMRFTDAYAACPICAPSRAAIMTGKFPSRTGFVDNYISTRKGETLARSKERQFMELKEVTLAEALRAGGYQTGFLGKWHLSASDEIRLPTDQGFDVNVAGGWWGHPRGRTGYFSPYQMAHLKDGPKGEYLPDRLTTEAIRVMDEFSQKDKPWLLTMSYYTVHSPFHSKPEKTRKYAEKAGKAKLKLKNPKYAGMVESLDENVGRMLLWLDGKGLRKNTIVIFTSDNGGMVRATENAPLRSYKGDLYEGGIRVPLIIDWPGVIEPGSVSNAPVHGVDFYATMLAMAGLPAQPGNHRDSMNLVPLLKGDTTFDRGPMVWHYPVAVPHIAHSKPGSVIRHGDWKYIQWYEDGRRELYNLKDDIGESKDLLQTMPEKAAEMKARLDALLEKHGAQIPPSASASVPLPEPEPRAVNEAKTKGLLARFDFSDGNLLNNQLKAGVQLVQRGQAKVETVNGTAKFMPASTPRGSANWLEAAFPRLKTFTLSFWLKTDSVDQGGPNQGIVSSGTLADRASWQLQSDGGSGGHLSLLSGSGGGVRRTAATTPHRPNTWYHVVLSSRDGQDLRMTISSEGGKTGDLAGELTHPGPVALARIALGANRARNQTYGMQLANVQVYDAAIPATTLFAAGRAGGAVAAPKQPAQPALPSTLPRPVTVRPPDVSPVPPPSPELIARRKAAGLKPNILLFLVDDMGLMDTSVPMLTDENGNPKRHSLNDWYRTPGMERLAAQGTRFSNFYSHNVCSPTRVSIMTGQNSARHRTSDWINPYKKNGGGAGPVPSAWNWEGLGKGDVTLPAVMKQAGYTTIHVGKAHFAPDKHEGADPRDLGFDVNIGGSAIGHPRSYYGRLNYGKGSRQAVPHLDKYHGTDTFLTEALTLEARAELDKALAVEKPFFLYMTHYAVHAPFNSDPRFAAQYQDAGKSKAAQAYATLIEGMDKSLGDLLDHLQARGVAENTLVLFLGDNGGDAPLAGTDDISSSAPLRGRKGSKWEGGVRVPFIAAWAKPGPENKWQKKLPIPAGAVREEIGTCYDLFPTIIDLVGAPVPADHTVDGQVLTRLLSGEADPKHRNQFLNHYPHPRRGQSHFFTTWRKADWKVRYEYFAESADRYGLYELAADPSESRNLAAENPDQLKRMMQGMVRELEDMGALYPVKDGQMVEPTIPQ